MALFAIDQPCPLCGQPLRVGHDIVATTHFIADRADPLYPYSDTVMHRTCFDQWESRDEFARRYRETMTAIYPRNRLYSTWPGPPGRNIVQEPPPPPRPPPHVPRHRCPNCHEALKDGARYECQACGWLQIPSDRTRWNTAGPCPNCGFSYRFDGATCSHCGHGRYQSP